MKRALGLVDELVIAIGINDTKNSYFSLEKRIEMIEMLYKDEPRVRISSYSSLTVDFAKEVGCQYIIRGIRSVTDFEYEKTIADMNRHYLREYSRNATSEHVYLINIVFVILFFK